MKPFQYLFKYFSKDKWDGSLHKVQDKSAERLTIMVIPHGQQEIFSLQINWGLIAFFVATLILAVSLSTYGFYWKMKKGKETRLLQQRYGKNLNIALKINLLQKKNIDLTQELFNKLTKTALIIGFKESRLDDLPDYDSSFDKAEKILRQEVIKRIDMGPASDYLPPIYSEKSLEMILLDRMAFLNSLTESVNDGLGVYSVMPLGRPVNMSVAIDTSLFGRRINPITGRGAEFHSGVDMAAARGTPVYATAAGYVAQTKYSRKGYGNEIILKHGNGFYTVYAHLSAILVKPGMLVVRGAMIGRVGRSGRTTGSHLHYEVRLNNSVKINPMRFLCATDLYTKNCIRENRKYEKTFY